MDAATRDRVWQMRFKAPRDGDGDGFYSPFKGAPDKTPVPPKVPKQKTAPKPKTGVAAYRERLRAMDADTLEASLRVLDSGGLQFANPADGKAARRAVLAEMARRDRAARKAQEQAAKYEALRAENPGMDEITAWALATGQDPQRFRRKMERMGRPSVAQLRQDWELLVETEYLAAEAATNGQMVRAAGKLKINPRHFWRRNAAYVNRWASEEFKQWAAEHGLTTFAAYRAMVEGQGLADALVQVHGMLGEWG